MSCILFLDFDGVTHPDPCPKTEFFRQLPLIEGVIDSFKSVEIVISSSWRYDHQLPALKALLSSEIARRVIDVTPTVRRTDNEGWIPDHLLQHHREWECRKWLKQNRTSTTPWLAIDDAVQWFTPDCANLLMTHSDFGFLPEQIPELVRMLKKATGELGKNDDADEVR